MIAPCCACNTKAVLLFTSKDIRSAPGAMLYDYTFLVIFLIVCLYARLQCLNFVRMGDENEILWPVVLGV